MPVKAQKRTSKVKTKAKSMEMNENIIELLESIPLNSFNNDQSKEQPVFDHLEHSRAILLEKKAKRIADLLEDIAPNLPTRHLSHFREFAMDSGGLIRGEFRAEIWPLLADEMPYANNVGDDNETDSRDTLSLRSRNFHLSPPNGNLIAESSRTGSESEVFDSARSSFGSDDFEADDVDSTTESPVSVSLEELQRHPEWNQVELDVHRTLARFPPNISEPERRQLQGDLIPMIVELLHSNSEFRYYQGFHDVCLTLMLALDVEHAKRVGRRLVERSAFRNYLTRSLEESALRELQLMYVILYKCDPELENRMRHAELGTLFALSWPITWFSHSLHSYDQIALCFDMFLSADPLMPIYVSAALVLHRRKEIMRAEPEMPVLHHLLNHIPDDLDIEAVLRKARQLFNEYRPRMIQGKYLQEYEALCEREGRRHLVPPANTIKRHSVLQNPWIFGGVAVASVALYWVISSYQQQFSLF